MRLIAAAALLIPLAAAANPTGGTVSSGSANISTSGSTVTVNTSTSGTIINWTTFSIAAGETTRINQPSAAAVTLNRVTGPTPSSINGSLQSNGQVFLTNPNGIVFGSTASVNVAGFVASTLNISDSDFLSGNLRFTGTGGSVVNSGAIAASDYVALVGGTGVTLDATSNVGAGAGGVAIAAGSPVAMTISGGVFTSVNVGSDIAGAVIHFEGVVSTTGPFIAQTGGGSSLPRVLPPQPTIVNPGTLTITQNTGTITGTINWGTVTVATGVNVGSGSGSAVNLTAPGSGSVQIYGTLTTAQTPATTGVALNLEKREVSF